MQSKRSFGQAPPERREFSGISIHHFHGASTRVPVTQIAFGMRERHHMVELPGGMGSAARRAAPTGAGYKRSTRTSNRTPVAGGYPNLIGPDQAAQADAAYGRNADRLLALKRCWDPDNVFSATPLPAR